jgi:hypothetical protein
MIKYLRQSTYKERFVLAYGSGGSCSSSSGPIALGFWGVHIMVGDMWQSKPLTPQARK